MRQFKRNGFTIVELLVSIGIIALLLSVFAPAVLKSREAQRRVECGAHLRELGMAQQHHLAAVGRYATYTPLPGGQPYAHVRGHTMLLPYLEQQSVFDRIQPDERGFGFVDPPWVLKNPVLLSTAIPAFVCPSDDVRAGGNSYRACYGTTPGIHAHWTLGSPLPPSGIPTTLRGMAAARTPARILDGLSQTVMYSERLNGDGDPSVVTPWRDVYIVDKSPSTVEEAEQLCRNLVSAVGHFSSAGNAWIVGEYSGVIYNHVLPPNSPVPDCGAHSSSAFQGAMTARSLHPGGVNVCFGDGAVRFVSNDVDLMVWRAAATMYGGEPVQAP